MQNETVPPTEEEPGTGISLCQKSPNAFLTDILDQFDTGICDLAMIIIAEMYRELEEVDNDLLRFLAEDQPDERALLEDQILRRTCCE